MWAGLLLEVGSSGFPPESSAGKLELDEFVFFHPHRSSLIKQLEFKKGSLEVMMTCFWR